MKVTINGGHYHSRDSGAVGSSGLQEAEVTKNVMQLVAGHLRNVDYEVLEVQENELYQITSASNDFDADLFVSIHCNAAENTSAQGTETFCHAFGTESEKLAKCIQSQIVDSMGTVDRGVKSNSGFYVLRNTDCPAVLVELAFISNSDEESILADPAMQDKFAAAIARGVTDYVASIQAG